MKFSFLILCLLFIPLLLSSAFGKSIDTTYLQTPLTIEEIDQVDWTAATKDLDYGTNKKLQPPAKTTSANLDFLAPILKIIAFIAVIVLIIFLLYSFVGVQGLQKGTNKRFDPNAIINTQTIAEDIHDFDLPKLLQHAIQQQDYTVATRLYYLLAIKTLSEQDLIQWKKDKTNRNYINELTNIPLKNKFRALTTIFERVWYGAVAVDAFIFEDIRKEFASFVDDISAINNGRKSV